MPTTPPVSSRPRAHTTWHTMRRWRRTQRRAAFGGLLLLLVLGLAVFLASAATHLVHASPTRYGTDAARMQAAVQAAGWPQKDGIWCGIADIAAIVDYRTPSFPIDQFVVVTHLNSPALQSAWGTPDHNWNIAWGPGFLADISRDGGTDPRSMAAGLTALAGGGYHQLVDYHSAYTATAHLVADLVRTREPITVFVNAGSHSVLVSAVFAYGDPTNLNNVASLEVYDSGAGLGVGVQHYQVEQVSLNGWIWWWAYLGATYRDNVLDGRHALDPDPSVGPYTFDPSQGRNVHLWISHYVYIHPDSTADASYIVSPDWAFNQDGALIRGLHDEAPSGYTGPSVAMSIPAPPPPPPTATPTPTNTPVPTATPHIPPRIRQDPPDGPTAVASQLPTVAPTVARTSIPTPTPGSIFGFSLRPICFNSACAGADTVSALMLGGASSLSATALLLVGALLVRQRRRMSTRARVAHPDGETLASAALQAQPASEASESTATPPPKDVSAADGALQAVATSEAHEATSTADEVSPESGAPADLTVASERLVQLAEPAEATGDAVGAHPDGETLSTASSPDVAADAPSEAISSQGQTASASAEPDEPGDAAQTPQ
jgi:hypothetical protein